MKTRPTPPLGLASAKRDESPPLIPEHVMLQQIGVGAYGAVWLARSVTGILRAVKVVFRNHFDHERTYEREFAGLKNFEPISRAHDGLMDILQVGRNDAAGYFYCVMELADDAGSGNGYAPLTVAEHVRMKGKLSVSECARIGAGVAEGLEFLHRHGLVHRDVKPSNIIFVNGRPKLADIGLVTNVGAARSFVGTDGFIPPEGPGTPSADVYGLGKTLYEMATGRNRLDFPDLPADSGASGDGGDFIDLNEIILRACGPTPKDRHGSVEELRGELLLVEAGRSIRRLRRNERLVKIWRRVGAAAAVALLLAAVVIRLERRQVEIAQREAATQAEQRRIVEEQERRARENLYAADMNLTQQAIEDGNYGRAQALLSAYLPAAGREDLRGFEWFYYWQKVQGDSIGVLRGHEQVVSCLALMPDGKRLLSGSFDSTLREWSIDERRELRRWHMPGLIVGAMALDASGTRVACEGGNRRFSAMLNLENGMWITNISSESPSVVFTPDERRLLRGADTMLFGTNGVVEVINDRLVVEKTLSESGGRVVFNPRGELFATGSWGDTIKIWSWPEMAVVGVLKDAGTILGMHFSPDGRRLAGVARDGRLSVWDVASQKLVAQRITHGGAVVWSVAFSPDGKRIATGGNDQAVRTWDAETLREDHVYRGHGSEVWAVIWSKAGDELISAGKDATIRIWKAAPAAPMPEILEVAQRPAFSDDSRFVAGRLRNGGAVVWELPGAKPIVEIVDANEVAGFSHDEQQLVVLGPGHSAQQRNLADGGVVKSETFGDAPTNFTKRAMSRSGRWLASGYRNGDTLLQERGNASALLLRGGHNDMIVSLAISVDETRLLTGSIDRSARLWELPTGRELHAFKNHKMGVGAVAFSRDGTKVATGSWDDTAHVWDAATGKELMMLEGHDGGVQAVEFAPDNRTLFALTGTSILKFWNLPAQREAGQVRLPSGVRQGWLAASPDGQWLAAVSQSETLTILYGPRKKIEAAR